MNMNLCNFHRFPFVSFIFSSYFFVRVCFNAFCQSRVLFNKSFSYTVPFTQSIRSWRAKNRKDEDSNISINTCFMYPLWMRMTRLIQLYGCFSFSLHFILTLTTRISQITLAPPSISTPFSHFTRISFHFIQYVRATQGKEINYKTSIKP